MTVLSGVQTVSVLPSAQPIFTSPLARRAPAERTLDRRSRGNRKAHSPGPARCSRSLESTVRGTSGCYSGGIDNCGALLQLGLTPQWHRTSPRPRQRLPTAEISSLASLSFAFLSRLARVSAAREQFSHLPAGNTVQSVKPMSNRQSLGEDCYDEPKTSLSPVGEAVVPDWRSCEARYLDLVSGAGM